ncbi:MAG: HEAT repeat domain-containing protein [Vicinamibacterales bacterium]|nr:HEAT repeat domain-containing protein [Vicinamibacterales bacterium]
MAILVSALAFSAAAWAQPGQLANAQVERHAAQADLRGQVMNVAAQITAPAWIGYAVPAANADAQVCCGTRGGCCMGCRLEPDGGQGMFVDGQRHAAARLDDSAALTVLLRVSKGQIERIRLFSDDCAIDAAGAVVHWLDGASGAGSVALLDALASAHTSRRVADGALAAMAMQAEPAAVDRLITLARTGATPHLRGQALFWLGQRASSAAIGAITEALEKDPDTDVKRRAVFALSQLPPDEGVPRLMDVARTHSNPSVRKQAMFWLGQSKDPRALDFFAAILKR